MLKYSVRIGENNIKRDVLSWSEKYVAPDLSFVSGVTSQHYHVDKNELISGSIGGETNFSSLKLDTKNVCRNGYIVVKGKKYRIESGTKSTVSGGNFEYVNINGVYYYINGNTITVKNWLKQDWKYIDDKYVVKIVEGDVTGYVNDGYVELDTIYWIEDETVSIDGYRYIFDRYDKSEFSTSPGGIKYYDTGRSLYPEEVTDCKIDDSTGHGVIDFNHFDKSSDYIYVTKFTLRKHEDKILEFDNISFCTYFYYVFYKDNYCPVKKINGSYVCQIPSRLLPGHDESDVTTTTKDVEIAAGLDFPERISELKSYDAYVTIENTRFMVEYMIQNSNDGDDIAVYLSDDTHNLNAGDTITLAYSSEDKTNFPVYEIGGNWFVMYNNAKYMVEADIADTVTINDVEYDVSYPNGKVVDKDALVDIDGESVPMKYTDHNTLKRYGLIVTGNSQADEAEYEIVSYSGVSINGTVYRVMDYSNSPNDKCIIADMPLTTDFIIDATEGSSLLICKPYLNPLEYDDDFINDMIPKLSGFYVSNKVNTKFYSKNRAFGKRPITPNIGYLSSDNAKSSNDYDGIFDKLILFTNSGYIQLDIPLTMNVANNAMQEDTVKRDFYDKEKKKAINPIVDMEKDVYEPAFMVGRYNGSETDFRPISEIEVNLHFRTRNLDNWKVNDPNVNLEVSGEIKKDEEGKFVSDTTNDNWFCTDFYPYKQILESPEPEKSGIIKGDIVRRASDLMGLLYFDNDDVFYQKDNIAKSFLRFSYYDSPDPNTQSLLCTSTVFMDEHAMYKKYIDNSRRNVNDYGIVQETQYQRDENGNMKFPKQVVESLSGKTINRISVDSECLEGGHKRGRTKYNKDDIDIDALESDEKRISSRFIIKNKYATDTSSEGFYLYIFREYSENLRPKPIYMKVDFNHAGIGRTIPFIIPMKWTGSTENENEMLPYIRLTLDSTQNTHPTTGEKLPSHLELLKRGYPLSYIYAQTYIPLYAVYDFKNKKYVYVFDDRYVLGDDAKNNRLVLNLFELKIMDEKTATAETRAQVRNNNVERANIDINSYQFPSNI